jgi:hypothetical protein
MLCPFRGSNFLARIVRGVLIQRSRRRWSGRSRFRSAEKRSSGNRTNNARRDFLEKINRKYDKLLMWHVAEVDRLHVKKNHLVGCSYLVIIDYRFVGNRQRCDPASKD